ncbi:unnamed protein product [Closterium sp. NIES-53]
MVNGVNDKQKATNGTSGASGDGNHAREITGDVAQHGGDDDDDDGDSEPASPCSSSARMGHSHSYSYSDGFASDEADVKAGAGPCGKRGGHYASAHYKRGAGGASFPATGGSSGRSGRLDVESAAAAAVAAIAGTGAAASAGSAQSSQPSQASSARHGGSARRSMRMAARREQGNAGAGGVGMRRIAEEEREDGGAGVGASAGGGAEIVGNGGGVEAEAGAASAGGSAGQMQVPLSANAQGHAHAHGHGYGHSHPQSRASVQPLAQVHTRAMAHANGGFRAPATRSPRWRHAGTGEGGAHAAQAGGEAGGRGGGGGGGGDERSAAAAAAASVSAAAPAVGAPGAGTSSSSGASPSAGVASNGLTASSLLLHNASHGSRTQPTAHREGLTATHDDPTTALNPAGMAAGRADKNEDGDGDGDGDGDSSSAAAEDGTTSVGSRDVGPGGGLSAAAWRDAAFAADDRTYTSGSDSDYPGAPSSRRELWMAPDWQTRSGEAAAAAAAAGSAGASAGVGTGGAGAGGGVTVTGRAVGEPSGPYPELVGCLMYLMTCTRPDLAYPLSILARYVAPGRHRPEHMAAAKRVLRYLCSTSGMGLVLGGRSPVVLTGHADASWADNQATQRSSQGYTFSLGFGSVSWRATCSSSVLGSSCEAEIYAGAMAAQELRWLTYLLTDLGEPPCLLQSCT